MMESRVAILEVRVESLEKQSEEHELEDKRLHKYLTNIMEDLQFRLSNIERTGERFEADLRYRSERAGEATVQMKDIFMRLQSLERMAWIAIGSTGAFGAIVTYFGSHIMGLLKS